MAVYSTQRAEAKKKVNDIYDLQAEQVNKAHAAGVKEIGTAYDDQQRAVAVQKLINERKVAESIANLGLTDSGLNRTQQTAVQISAANAGYNLNRQKQADINAYNLDRDSKLSTIEQNRISATAGVDETYDGLEAEYKAAQAKAAAEAQQKYNTEKSSAVNNLYKHLTDSAAEPDYAAQLIDTLASKYDDISNTELSVLLRSAGLTASEFENYIKTGSIYSTNKYVESTNDGGRVLGSYKTLGKQDYKIKVVKDTTNWFGIGVDADDVVDIYYPDGKTLLKKNVKLKDLTKSVGLKLTESTKGNKGKTLTVSLDLSKEKLD